VSLIRSKIVLQKKFSKEVKELANIWGTLKKKGNEELP
jgi:hypothetical protein